MPDLSTITPVTREEEFLDRIARAAASPNLPEVDTSDNGDVLTVVSGEWAAAAPAGGLPEVTSGNNGQVLTVVSGEWAAAAPAGGILCGKVVSISDYTPAVNPGDDNEYTGLTNMLSSEYTAAAAAFLPIFFAVPNFTGESPYFAYDEFSKMGIIDDWCSLETTTAPEKLINFDTSGEYVAFTAYVSADA